MEKKMPREMTGAELKSMLKSSINFKSLGGLKCDELTLPPEDKQWWRDAKIGTGDCTPSWGEGNGSGLMRKFPKKNTKPWRTSSFPGISI